MEWFKIRWVMFFDKFYSNVDAARNLVHVTCSGYSSPSVAQQAAISREWQTTSYILIKWGVMGLFRLFVRQVV
jgi:hypothetical protein